MWVPLNRRYPNSACLQSVSYSGRASIRSCCVALYSTLTVSFFTGDSNPRAEPTIKGSGTGGCRNRQLPDLERATPGVGYVYSRDGHIRPPNYPAHCVLPSWIQLLSMASPRPPGEGPRCIPSSGLCVIGLGKRMEHGELQEWLGVMSSSAQRGLP